MCPSLSRGNDPYGRDTEYTLESLNRYHKEDLKWRRATRLGEKGKDIHFPERTPVHPQMSAQACTKTKGLWVEGGCRCRTPPIPGGRGSPSVSRVTSSRRNEESTDCTGDR